MWSKKAGVGGRVAAGRAAVGDWSMSMTLSMFPAPSMRSWAFLGRRPTRPASAFSSTSFTSVLFPERTPVTQVSAPRREPGVDAAQVVLARLLTVIQPFPGRRDGATGIARRPDR